MNYFGTYFGEYPGEWWGAQDGPQPVVLPRVIRLRSLTERSRM